MYSQGKSFRLGSVAKASFKWRFELYIVDAKPSDLPLTRLKFR